MKKILFFLCIGLASLRVAAQEFTPEHYQASRIKTATGLKLLFKSDRHSFSVEIKGEIDPAATPYIRVNKKYLLSYATVPLPQYINFTALSEEKQQQNLLSYKEYEMDWVRDSVLKVSELKTQSEFLRLNGRMFIYWSYRMPGANPSVHQQCYLVTYCFDQTLVFDLPVLDKMEEADVKKNVAGDWPVAETGLKSLDHN